MAMYKKIIKRKRKKCKRKVKIKSDNLSLTPKKLLKILNKLQKIYLNKRNLCMTNYQRWQACMENVNSPQSFIDLGFYWMISAALQRRVFLGSYEDPIFPNLFVVLVGSPGVGKGRVLGPVNDLLKYHKFIPKMNGTADINKLMADLSKPNALLKGTYEKYLFTPTPQSTTFQCLVRANAEAIRTISCSKTPASPNGIYVHSSMFVLLEELTSMLRKDHETLIKYLCEAFDCKASYEYESIGRGQDSVRKPCLGIFAGTTPADLYDGISMKVIGGGLISRTLFLYEENPRSVIYHDNSVSKESIKATKDLQDYLFKLSKLFGLASFTTEAREYMRHYTEEVHPIRTQTQDPILAQFLARKILNAHKLSIAIHFAESTEFTIGIESVEKGFSYLDIVEKNLSAAVQCRKRNPTAELASKLKAYLTVQTKPISYGEILMKFYDDGDERYIKYAIKFLTDTKQVMMIQGKGYVLVANVEKIMVTQKKV